MFTSWTLGARLPQPGKGEALCVLCWLWTSSGAVSKECAYLLNVVQLDIAKFSLLHAVFVVLRLYIDVAPARCHGRGVNSAHVLQAFAFVVVGLGMFFPNARSMKQRPMAEYVSGVGKVSAMLLAAWTGFE